MSSASQVWVVGEALLDVLASPDTSESRPGGSPANVAVALARLGTGVTFVTCLGDDAAGAAVREWLDRAGLALVVQPDAAGTSVARATPAGNGDVDYTFDVRWPLSAATARTVAERDPDCLHVGSLGTWLEPGAAVVRDLVDDVRARTLISYDPNIRPRLVTDLGAARGRVEDMVAVCDVVKASEEDVRALYPADDPVEVAERWCEGGPAAVVVTHARAGATAVTASGTVAVAGFAVDVVDTVGAGDAFTAMLLAGLQDLGLLDARRRQDLRALTAPDLERLLENANAAAALTCTRRGADPPDRVAVARLARS